MRLREVVCYVDVDRGEFVREGGVVMGARGGQRGEVSDSVKTHCYARSGGLIQSKGSAGMPKAVYD